MNKKYDIELLIFFFSIIFLPKIGLFDLKLIALLFYLIISFWRNKKIVIEKYYIFPCVILFCLVLLFFVNSFMNETDYLILLRYFRCILSIVVINNYLVSKRIKVDLCVKSISFVILLHALSIIFSIIIPASRTYIELFSQYNKKILPLRSTGLLSGYDFAGFFLSAALILRIMYNVKEKNKVFDLYCYIFIISIPLTSRLNALLLIFEIVIIILYMLKTKRISSTMSLLIIIPIILIGSIFSILTIEAFEPIKHNLIQKYHWVSVLDSNINMTYSDSNIIDAFESHYAIDKSVNRIIGNGITANRDPGVIKTIYEGGAVALILKFLFYLYLFYFSFKHRKKHYVFGFVCFYIILITIFEFKLLFYFATGGFELLIALLSAIYLQEVAYKSNISESS